MGVLLVRSELIKALAREHPGLSPAEAERALAIFFDEIAASLVAGRRVELRGFGIFGTRQHQSRGGRNPRTGAAVDIAEKRAAYFKYAKRMNLMLNKLDD